MGRPTMLVDGHKPDDHTLIITVDHAADASWSRAVDPRAKRAARDHIRAGEQWALVQSDYCQPTPNGVRWSRSIYRFERKT